MHLVANRVDPILLSDILRPQGSLRPLGRWSQVQRLPHIILLRCQELSIRLQIVQAIETAVGYRVGKGSFTVNVESDVESKAGILKEFHLLS